MAKILAVVIVVVALVGLSGCIAVSTPASGILFTDVKGPLGATGEKLTGEIESGKATAQAILGLVATGDASITAAAKDGRIKKITHVDHHSTNILGIIGTYTTIVYGYTE